MLTLLGQRRSLVPQAEQLALSGLDNDVLDLDDFSRRVETLGPPPTADFAVNNTPASRAWCCSLPDALDWPQTLPALATHLLTQGFVQPSFVVDGRVGMGGPLSAAVRGVTADTVSRRCWPDWRERGWSEKPLAGIDGDSGAPSVAERTNYEHETTLSMVIRRA